jgi:transforming growth factor-beta-induced protein
MKSTLRFGAVAMSAALLFAACGDDTDSSAPDTTVAEAAETTEAVVETPAANIVETAVAAGSFETLVAAVQAAGLVDTLSGEGPFTVFAPTDEAFAALPEGLVAALLEDTDTLAQILTYHVVAGQVLAADVVGLTEATSVQGDTIDITVSDAGVMVDGANVVTTDILTSNGVIHVIDAVILPEGIVLPEHGMMEEATEEEMSEEAMGGTIVDVAAEAGTFTTLLAAAEAAGLVDTLNSDGPFTVFAPTDDAFAALPEGTVEGLLADPDALRAILLYHVVAGDVRAADVVNLTSATTVNGADVSIEVVDGQVLVGGATVVAADVEASNGVIHVIDAVLIP